MKKEYYRTDNFLWKIEYDEAEDWDDYYDDFDDDCFDEE